MITITSSVTRALGLLALVLLIAPLASAQVTGAGERVVAATYLGGGSTDYGRAVALDAQGNIYLGGDSFSTSVLGRNLSAKGGQDIMVAKLSPDAKQLLGLFSIGSSSTDRLGGMAVTPGGEVVALVETDNPSFPTVNALRTAPADSYNSGVLLKINAAMDGLVFSTFTSFSVAAGLANVAVDRAGNIAAAGYVYTPAPIARDLALQRFSADGRQLLFDRVWNGDRTSEQPQALALLPDGTTFIAGYTEGWDGDFAVTDNALQKLCGRKLELGDDRQCDDDAFVLRLDPAGNVSYASYLGADGSDRAAGLAVDAQGAMYLTGSTSAPGFPTTPDALQASCPRAEADDGCYYDTWVAKVGADGRLVYSTFLSSSDVGGLDYPGAIAVDAAGQATVVGTTASERWPVTDAVQGALKAAPCPNAFQDRFCFDSFVTTLTPAGRLAFSSYLGGTGDEWSTGVAVGPNGALHVTGYSSSRDYPFTAGGAQPGLRGGDDFFLAQLKPAAGSGTPTAPPSGRSRQFVPLALR